MEPIKILSVDDELDLELLLTQYFRRKIRKGEYEFNRFNVKLEVNEVNLLLDIVRESNMATVISHATVARVPGLKALTLDTQGTSMEGAFNVRKGAYMKLATKEFLRLRVKREKERRCEEQRGCVFFHHCPEVLDYLRQR